MKLEYRLVSDGTVLDTVVITRQSIIYSTGAAKEMFRPVIKGPGGYPLAMAKFKSWSNGYVSTFEIVR